MYLVGIFHHLFREQRPWPLLYLHQFCLFRLLSSLKLYSIYDQSIFFSCLPQCLFYILTSVCLSYEQPPQFFIIFVRKIL